MLIKTFLTALGLISASAVTTASTGASVAAMSANAGDASLSDILINILVVLVPYLVGLFQKKPTSSITVK